MRIEPFQLERWMTKYEMNVKWDIAESGVCPMSSREILELLPPEDRESERDRLLDLQLGYSEACGSEELRSLLAATYENTSADEILVTTGAIEANFLLFNELLSAGDRVVAVSPAYQQLHSVAKAIGCEVALWTLRDDGGFRFELDDLRALATPGTRMIVINSPHNPTGAMLSEDQLREIYLLAEELDAWVLSDEAYRWLDLPGVLLSRHHCETSVRRLSVPARFQSRSACRDCGSVGSLRRRRSCSAAGGCAITSVSVRAS